MLASNENHLQRWAGLQYVVVEFISMYTVIAEWRLQLLAENGEVD